VLKPAANKIPIFTLAELWAALNAISQMTDGNARSFDEWKIMTHGSETEWSALLRAEAKLRLLLEAVLNPAAKTITMFTTAELSAALEAISQVINNDARNFDEWKSMTNGSKIEWNALLRAEAKLKLPLRKTT
jgi:hypothetical protein